MAKVAVNYEVAIAVLVPNTCLNANSDTDQSALSIGFGTLLREHLDFTDNIYCTVLDFSGLYK